MNVSVFSVKGTEQNKDEIIAQQCDEILMLKSEITFLKESVSQLKKMIFGSKSEKFDLDQQELNLGLNEIIVEAGKNDEEAENIIPIKKRKRNNRRTRISENIRTTVEIIRPDEVVANPEKYRQVGEAEERKSIHYQQS